MRPLTEDQETWVTALESGEYKQGTNGWLCDDGRFSCFGVACQVLLGDADSEIQGGIRVWGGRVVAAADAVVERLGLNDAGGALECAVLHGFSDLAAANDAGVTFKEIAAFIRAHPEAVFSGKGGEQ